MLTKKASQLKIDTVKTLKNAKCSTDYHLVEPKYYYVQQNIV